MLGPTSFLNPDRRFLSSMPTESVDEIAGGLTDCVVVKTKTKDQQQLYEAQDHDPQHQNKFECL
jgi:hypothetical protein